MNDLSINDILGLSRNQSRTIVEPLFAYLFGGISQRQFINYVDDKDTTTRILKAIKSSGYIMRDCKLYAYHRYAGNPTKPAAFNINRRDVPVLNRVEPHYIDPKKYPAMTIPQFDMYIAELYTSSEMTSYVGRLITAKMTFLIRSFGWDRETLSGMLFEAAVFALQKQYPYYKSHLHFKNIAKTTIHNTAMTFITTQTKGKRQRLYQNEDGTFSSFMGSMAEAEQQAAPDNTDFQHMMQSLMQLGPRMSDRVQQYILCLAGKPHEGLSEFLAKDNTEAAHKMEWDEYRTRVEAYFQVNRQQTDALFARLRPHLS